MEKELIYEELHKLVAEPDEPFDIDWEDFLWDKIQSEGELVASHDWNSGGPGAGAGCVNIWKFRSVYVVAADDFSYGPFTSFKDAVYGSSFYFTTEATTEIWVHDRELKTRTEFPNPSALTLRHPNTTVRRVDSQMQVLDILTDNLDRQAVDQNLAAFTHSRVIGSPPNEGKSGLIRRLAEWTCPRLSWARLGPS